MKKKMVKSSINYVSLVFNWRTYDYKIYKDMNCKKEKDEVLNFLSNKDCHIYGYINNDSVCWEYNNLSYEAQMAYWNMVFSDIYSSFIAWKKDIDKDYFIKMRNNFEKTVFGRINYSLWRFPEENIDINDIDIIKGMLERFKYGWIVGTYNYRNEKKNRSEEIFRYQSVVKENNAESLLYDDNYHLYSWLRPRTLTYRKENLRAEIDNLVTMANFVPLLVNTIESLTMKVKKRNGKQEI